MGEISFEIVNRADHVDPIDVVIYQRNGPLGNGSLPVALESYTLHRFSKTEFNIDPHLAVTASLTDNRSLISIAVKLGQLVNIEGEPGKIRLSLDKHPVNPAGTVSVVNKSANNDVTLDLCRGLHPLMRRDEFPQYYAVVFDVVESFWIGVSSQKVQPGQVLSGEVLAELNAEIGYQGISSASIVIKGGGTGRNAQPYNFDLENVKEQ